MATIEVGEGKARVRDVRMYAETDAKLMSVLILLDDLRRSANPMTIDDIERCVGEALFPLTELHGILSRETDANEHRAGMAMCRDVRI